MDAAGSLSAHIKLNNVVPLIGHPDVEDLYSGVALDPTRFTFNVKQLLNSVKRQTLQTIGQQSSRFSFDFDPVTVNAFYYPLTNTINFPAAILESPMFSGTWPKLFQFARMGFVVGHELVHGFDNKGSQFNAYGTFVNSIYDQQTTQNFAKEAVCVENMFDQYQVIPGIHVNGAKSLPDNIADLGGAQNAYEAYQLYVQQYGDELHGQRIVPFLNNEQLFFVVLGQTWCAKYTEAALIDAAEGDHAPAMFRVIGPLSDFSTFATAFGCPKGSPMNPTAQCSIWSTSS
jgi:predicted metalloendopeptidase